MTADELAAWLGAHGWQVDAVSDGIVTVSRDRGARRQARSYVRQIGLREPFWAIDRPPRRGR